MASAKTAPDIGQTWQHFVSIQMEAKLFNQIMRFLPCSFVLTDSPTVRVYTENIKKTLNETLRGGVNKTISMLRLIILPRRQKNKSLVCAKRLNISEITYPKSTLVGDLVLFVITVLLKFLAMFG
jgi:hypothetical protein